MLAQEDNALPLHIQPRHIELTQRREWVEQRHQAIDCHILTQGQIQRL